MSSYGIFIAFLIGFLAVQTPVQAQTSSSPTNVQNPVRPSAPLLPDVFPKQSASPQAPVQAAAPAPALIPAVQDPCQDYKDSAENYAICQDQIKKIHKMIDASIQRSAEISAPAQPTAPAFPTAPTAPSPPADPKSEAEPKPPVEATPK